MIIEFSLQVSPRRLRINIPIAKILDDIPNSVAYDLSNNAPLEFGVEKEEFQQRATHHNPNVSIGFRPLFSVDNVNANLECAFLEYYAALAHHKIFPANLLGLRYFFIDRFDYNLQLPGYEQLSLLDKIEFEEHLRRPGRARNITINGKPETIPPKKRKFESTIRFLMEFVPVLLIIVSLLLYRENIIKALAGISLAILIFIFGQAIWIYSIKRSLPRDYLNFRLPKVSFSFVARRIANFLWQESSIIEK